MTKTNAKTKKPAAKKPAARKAPARKCAAKKTAAKKAPAKRKTESYTVFDSARGKTFKTLPEARAYANAYARKTGEIVAVEQTGRKVTHTYGASSVSR